MNFEKKDRCERVIQFGEGGFLRGFADWMIQKMNDKGLTNNGVVIVQPIKKGMCDELTKQDCIYTHIIRGAEGVEKTVVDSITRCVKPYDDYEEYFQQFSTPRIEIMFNFVRNWNCKQNFINEYT